MNLMKTLPALAVLTWVAAPFALEAAKAERNEEPTPSVKTTKADRLALDRINAAFEVVSGCSAQTWPQIAPSCLSNAPADTPVRAARFVAIERRDEANQTSVVMRMPLYETASR